MKYASIIVFCIGLFLCSVCMTVYKDYQIRDDIRKLENAHNQLANAFIAYAKDPNTGKGFK